MPERSWPRRLLRLFGAGVFGYFVGAGVGAVIGTLVALAGRVLNLPLPFLVPLAVGTALIAFGGSGLVLDRWLLPRLGPRPGRALDVSLHPVVHWNDVTVGVRNNDPPSVYRVELLRLIDEHGKSVSPHQWPLVWEGGKPKARAKIITGQTRSFRLCTLDSNVIRGEMTGEDPYAVRGWGRHWNFVRPSHDSVGVSIDLTHEDTTDTVAEHRITATCRVIRESPGGFKDFDLILYPRYAGYSYEAVCELAQDA